MARKLSMGVKGEKAGINNSPNRAVGVALFIGSIEKAEPFASLFNIKPKILEAIREDMKANGFDPSKPVNVWKTEDGRRILIDGYTRIRAAEELGFINVTAYERTFEDEAEALAYAIHTQRDRRNLSDDELFRLFGIVDKPQEGFKAAIASTEAIGEKPQKTAEITASALGTSRSTVERMRTVSKNPAAAAAVLAGQMTINQAANKIRAKRTVTPTRAAPAPLPGPEKARQPLPLPSVSAETGKAADVSRTDLSGIVRKAIYTAREDARSTYYANGRVPFDAGYYEGLKAALEILDKHLDLQDAARKVDIG